MLCCGDNKNVRKRIYKEREEWLKNNGKVKSNVQKQNKYYTEKYNKLHTPGSPSQHICSCFFFFFIYYLAVCLLILVFLTGNND
jgi:hypothetical protein